ncbi:MAG: hypothetical protein ACYDEQ_05600 [Desulfocucumaceae bacterium]
MKGGKGMGQPLKMTECLEILTLKDTDYIIVADGGVQAPYALH